MAQVFPEVQYRPERAGQEIIIPQRQAAHEWGTQQRGSYYAVGIGGSLTGRGFDIGIIDDPVKDAEEAGSAVIRDRIWDWYRTVFRTRANPDAAIIVIMTRWHQDDLVGRLLNQSREDRGSDIWEILSLEAIDNAGKALWGTRYPIEVLDRIKASIGSRAFTSLYQGNPVAAEGNIIKREWWKYYKVRSEYTRLVQSWDTAFKAGQANDYSVCTLWGESNSHFDLIDVWRERVEFPEMERAVIAAYDRDKPSVVLIEDAASGQSLIQTLKKETRLPIKPVKADKDKVARANAVTPLIEAGRVRLPERASWLHNFVEEVSAFPSGEHDDQVDTMTQALNYMAGRPEKQVLFV
jgi:predicted phage terminase large subunit-like protein